MEIQRGKVRVGTCSWQNSTRLDPSFPGFTSIVCLTQSSAYGMLGPYCLTSPTKFEGDDKIYDVIVENKYQFSKVYETVPECKEVRSRYDDTVIWTWPSERHIFYMATKNPDGTENPIPQARILSNYLNWRKAGMLVKDPIRYPVNRNNMNTCLFSLDSNPDGSLNPQVLNYVESRKKIYLKYYCDAVKKHPMFTELQNRLNSGENLLIIEVDGPRSRNMPYYKEKYGVNDNFIEADTIIINEQNLDLLLNDAKERFGHGYCLAGSLLGIY